MKSLSRKFRSHPAFTIVELLIVIVVIGILAAISIVAYRGIQERAASVAYMAAVDSWEKLLHMEYVQTGSIPSTNLGTYCLGRSVGDFPETNSFAAGACVSGVDIATDAPTSTSFNEAYIAQFATQESFPSGLVREVRSNLPGFAGKVRGISILSHTDEGRTVVYLIWAPPRNGMCGRGDEWNTIAPSDDPLVDTGSCGRLLVFE